MYKKLTTLYKEQEVLIAANSGFQIHPSADNVKLDREGITWIHMTLVDQSACPVELSPSPW